MRTKRLERDRLSCMSGRGKPRRRERKLGRLGTGRKKNQQRKIKIIESKIIETKKNQNYRNREKSTQKKETNILIEYFSRLQQKHAVMEQDNQKV